MENQINILEEKLKAAEQLQRKTPSPAVWANIEKRLEKGKKKPITVWLGRPWMRIAAGIALVVGLGAIFLFTIDRNQQSESWIACSDCIESLRDQALMANLPISVSTRSLYQPFFRMSNGPEIYAATERLSATSGQNIMQATEILQALAVHASEDRALQATDIIGIWQIQEDRKQAFRDDFSLNREGKLQWTRTDSDGNVLYSGNSVESFGSQFTMLVEHHGRSAAMNAYVEHGNLLLDLTAFNGRYYRWQPGQEATMLFTAILPMQSYSSQQVIRFAEQNVVLGK